MDEEETWVRFSEVGINARMRNALELFALRKEGAVSPAATPLTAPLQSRLAPIAQAGVACGTELRVPAALTWEGAGDAAGLALAGEEASGEELRRKA